MSVSDQWRVLLNRAQDRVMEKLFGIFVAPGNSPVTPEI